MIANVDIRTYSVVPLNEEHGIVEWVPHTRVLRDIILKYLRQKGIQYNVRLFCMCIIGSTLRYEVFLTQLPQTQVLPNDSQMNYFPSHLLRYMS